LGKIVYVPIRPPAPVPEDQLGSKYGVTLLSPLLNQLEFATSPDTAVKMGGFWHAENKRPAKKNEMASIRMRTRWLRVSDGIPA
jgi:hypothetical protein